MENRNRHEFLLDMFFDDTEEKTVLKIKGWVLVKYYSNNTHAWEVSIYTKGSYAKYIVSEAYQKVLLKNKTLDKM